jgi:2-oxoglutarate dehydrogenase E1 component
MSPTSPTDYNHSNGFDSSSLSFVESVYRQYLQNPSSVSSDWRKYFEGDYRAAAEHLLPAIGVQFMHIDDLEVRSGCAAWRSTENRLELSPTNSSFAFSRSSPTRSSSKSSPEEVRRSQELLAGRGESLIPLLDLAIEQAGEQGVEEIVMGMAHRGRLNVLATSWEKRPADLPRVRGPDPELNRRPRRRQVPPGLQHRLDDDRQRQARCTVALLQPQPPGVRQSRRAGPVRAKQDRAATQRKRGLVLLIHGDAAFAAKASCRKRSISAS